MRIILLLLIAQVLASAQTSIVITDKTEFVELIDNNYTIYVDSTAAMSFEQVRNQPFETGHPLYNKTPRYAYWLRIEMNTAAVEKSRWLLEILDSRQQDVEVYLPMTRGYEKVKMGLPYSYEDRQYGHKNFVLDLPVGENNSSVVYLRFQSPYVVSMLCKIRKHSEFTTYAVNEYYFLGFFYGLLTLIVVYNLFLFLFVKENIYLYYALFVLSWAFHSLCDDGIGYQYLWTSMPWISTAGQMLSRPLFVLCLIVYSFEFIELRKRVPSSVAVIGTLYGGYLFLNIVNYWWNLPYVQNSVFLIPLIVIFYYAWTIFRSGYKPARFFLIGNGFILIGIFMRVLKDSQVIEMITDSMNVRIFGIYSQNVGVFMEILVMTVALADRLRYMKRKDEEAQNTIIKQLQENELLSQKVTRELEVKVNERTVELQAAKKVVEEANDKLQHQAEEIQRMNALLDMDNYKLKKKVQEVTEARVKFKDVSYEEFSNIFPNDLSCQRYLEEIKWSKGYACKKCNNTKYSEGVKKFSRRCTKCGYNESITAYTLLHKCKFPLPKAMYILMKVYRYGEKNSLNQMSEQLQLRKSTVWAFKEKVLECMKTQKSKGNNFDDNLAQLILSSKAE